MSARHSAARLSLVPLLLAAAATLPALAPADAASKKKAEPVVESTALGAFEYRTFCASCHGADGKGNGPIAPMLKVAPSNLTTLAQGNGGTFPRARVQNFIDGRTAVAAHGSRDMPVWGDWFNQEAVHDELFLSQAVRDVGVKARIEGLVVYIEKMQVK